MMPKYTYLTLLGSDDYLQGTIALIRSLKMQKSKYPITVLVTDNVSNMVLDYLKLNNIKYKIAKKIEAPNSIKKNNGKNSYSNWTNTFSKLLIFGMVEYDKIVFLDSDMLILRNIDELFTKQHLSGVIAGRSFPGNENWKDINSGIMVIKPKKDEDKRLISILNEVKYPGKMGDQDIIRLGYPNWSKYEELHLSESYNIFAKYEPYYVSQKVLNTPIKVLHFVGKRKPWNMKKTDVIKYYLKLSKLQLKKAKSLKGISKSIKDFKYYRKICSLKSN